MLLAVILYICINYNFANFDIKFIWQIIHGIHYVLLFNYALYLYVSHGACAYITYYYYKIIANNLFKNKSLKEKSIFNRSIKIIMIKMNLIIRQIIIENKYYWSFVNLISILVLFPNYTISIYIILINKNKIYLFIVIIIWFNSILLNLLMYLPAININYLIKKLAIKLNNNATKTKYISSTNKFKVLLCFNLN